MGKELTASNFANCLKVFCFTDSDIGKIQFKSSFKRLLLKVV